MIPFSAEGKRTRGIPKNVCLIFAALAIVSNSFCGGAPNCIKPVCAEKKRGGGGEGEGNSLQKRIVGPEPPGPIFEDGRAALR